ncbi:hypothetical protein GE061_003127 [Apolygus lucorum]|uniref:Uncharacterized protein n=1 Tax=Apolygus lucorum TaxID=248454 RepID=A0A8S9X575_APOLU|nr:hypothetical protein GE061_003127 [Apolygus lucorum]
MLLKSANILAVLLLISISYEPSKSNAHHRYAYHWNAHGLVGHRKSEPSQNEPSDSSVEKLVNEVLASLHSKEEQETSTSTDEITSPDEPQIQTSIEVDTEPSISSSSQGIPRPTDSPPGVDISDTGSPDFGLSSSINQVLEPQGLIFQHIVHQSSMCMGLVSQA